ncbi:iron chelate uptake ABC transporter family permease subunit [Leucobacter sp. PH1c]|uniref:FecCD family ABC transporter permease n=1 Tax=Leucobacter sp. PH1c TaxID=1397278 RepID=UPI00046AD944|nr:iron chelate uptake ABC transporter family permease subunit [Leucobacter sp. PH1c]
MSAPLAQRLRTSRTARIRRDALVCALLALLALALFAVSLVWGNSVTPIGEVLRVLAGEPVPGASFVVGELRLPRALGGLLAGLAFGLGGTLFQTMLRNVLASPDVIGISAGASASAIIAIGLFGASGIVVSGVAVLGALAAALLVWACAYRRGLSGIRFVLVGIAVAAALQAVISYVLTRSDVRAAQEAVVWMTGSLSRSLWDQLGPTAPVLLVLIALGLFAAARLQTLRLGDDTAAALGVRVQAARLGVILCGVLLIAVATSLTGPIAFVAFLAGPIALRLVRRAEAVPVAAALVGALLVLGGDLIAQHLTPAVLPVGVVTGLLGAPVLLILLMRGRTRV